MLPKMMLADDLKRGDLVTVLPNWIPKHGIIHVVFPSRRGLLPSVRALIDHLSASFEAITED
ncbi:LysR substrate binding domain protein [compost metagenome]